MSRKIIIACLSLFILQGMGSLAVGQSLASFVPKNYAILDTIFGDLNMDSLSDVVLILKVKSEKDTSNADRPLLILEGLSKDKFKLAGRNDHIVFCASCGGGMGDPYHGATIEKGSFAIMHYGGSAQRWTQIITFTYQAKTGKYILQSDAGESFNSMEPSKIKKIKNQKENWGKVDFEQYSNAGD
jgi:hypothetical protein